jgi:hypothetical protein
MRAGGTAQAQQRAAITAGLPSQAALTLRFLLICDAIFNECQLRSIILNAYREPPRASAAASGAGLVILGRSPSSWIAHFLTPDAQRN